MTIGSFKHLLWVLGDSQYHSLIDYAVEHFIVSVLVLVQVAVILQLLRAQLHNFYNVPLNVLFNLTNKERNGAPFHNVGSLESLVLFVVVLDLTI